MTDNIDKIVQEAECVAAADEYFKARTWLMDTNDNRRIFEAGFDRAYALLSKLRAPVDDERITWIADYEPLYYFAQHHKVDYNALCTAARAALASAPVAGEAQSPIGYVDPVYVAGRQRGMPWNAKIYDAPNQEATAPLYATPQASEAVRDQALDDAEEAVVTLYENDDPVYLPDIALAIRALKSQSAALSAQPGAQRTGGSDE